MQQAWATALLVGDACLPLDDRVQFNDAVEQPFVREDFDGLRQYRGLLRGGVMGCFTGLFPQTTAMLTEQQRWQLIEHFRRLYPNSSPQFAPMFKPFADFLDAQQYMPKQVVAMARFEWAQAQARNAPEYRVLLASEVTPEHYQDLTTVKLVFNPTISVIECQWPLHELKGVDFLDKPDSWTEQATNLMVFREPKSHQVKTYALNPVLFLLVNGFLAEPSGGVAQVVEQVTGHPLLQGVNRVTLHAQITNLIAQWFGQGVIIACEKLQ